MKVRPVMQAETSGGILDSSGISPIMVHLKVDYNRSTGRLFARRQWLQCDALFNLVSNPPKVEGRCGREGDNTPDAIASGSCKLVGNG